VKKDVVQTLVKTGWERKLRNSIFCKMMSYHPPPHYAASQEHIKEPNSYIRRAQANWEKRILKSLNSMCTELSVPLARKRPEKEQKDMLGRWAELGTDEPDLSQFRPVYAPKDFLEVIASLKNPNVVDCGDNTVSSCAWGIIQAPVYVKDLHQLRLQYSEMAINQCQSGIDDGPELPSEVFEADRAKLARKVLAAKLAPATQEFAKKGIPLSHRAQMWSQILNVEVDDVDILYYEQLKTGVLQHDLLVDSLIYKDVKLTATNDDQYFVFEDYLYQVLLPFSRDTTILQHFNYSSASPAKSYIRGKLGVDEFAVNYPPNGVIPFHGFSMYVCPLCYIYNDIIHLYFVFREMYNRYFFRLHTLSSHPQVSASINSIMGIVSLCLQFERLLQTHEAILFFHLKSIGVQPLRLAFKWLIRAFSGYLSSEQVLLLWDRILAFDSLEILPVLAVAIFTFRKTNLLQVQTFSASEAVLADITTLKVIPLIQLALFSQ
ncbi:hypothetical protein CAPTEDRAFT_108817, partial [Capitella teleta]